MFKKYDKKNIVIISPDVGAVSRTVSFAKRLNLPVVICSKIRDYSKISTIENISIISNIDLTGKIGLIVDDIVDSCSTLISCINVLKKRGVIKIFAIITQ